MLVELISKVLIEPVYDAVLPLWGKWSSAFGQTADFFWLFPLIFVPSLILAAPIAFFVEGFFARRVRDRRRRSLLAVSGGLLYALLSGVSCLLTMPGSDPDTNLKMMFEVPWIMMLPTSAVGVFGFWLPSVACGIYATLTERPKWWVAGIIGTATLLVGVWFWIALGVLVGAETD
jgi:hypothetical protein